MELTPRWRVAIIGGKGFEWLGTVDAPNHREAYRLAIRQFKVPIDRQNRLFVSKSDKKA
jgi:hypothetical protein